MLQSEYILKKCRMNVFVCVSILRSQQEKKGAT